MVGLHRVPERGESHPAKPSDIIKSTTSSESSHGVILSATGGVIASVLNFVRMSHLCIY